MKTTFETSTLRACLLSACPCGLQSFQKKNQENLSPKGMFSMFYFEQVIRRIGGVDADFLGS